MSDFYFASPSSSYIPPVSLTEFCWLGFSDFASFYLTSKLKQISISKDLHSFPERHPLISVYQVFFFSLSDLHNIHLHFCYVNLCFVALDDCSMLFSNFALQLTSLLIYLISELDCCNSMLRCNSLWEFMCSFFATSQTFSSIAALS